MEASWKVYYRFQGSAHAGGDRVWMWTKMIIPDWDGTASEFFNITECTACVVT